MIHPAGIAHIDDAPDLSSEHACLERLARLVEHEDGARFDEIVSLIARLSIPIDVLSD